jgi:DNA gyrase subunit A
VCTPEDQLFVVASNGVIIRTRVDQIRPSGRDTMGVTLMSLSEGDLVVAVARGAEADEDDDDTAGASDAAVEDAGDADGTETEGSATE